MNMKIARSPLLLSCLLAVLLTFSLAAPALGQGHILQGGTPPPPIDRPMLVVLSYSSTSDPIAPGEEFTLKVRLSNAGHRAASNIMAVFTSTELIPLQTGGVLAVKDLGPGDKAIISQPLSASDSLWGSSLASVSLQVTYTDPDGVQYTETFSLSLQLYTPGLGGPTATPTATPTPAPVLRPQLVISSYTTDVSVLQPGSQFNVQMNVENMGNADARHITMIVGGGSASPGQYSGTPEPGGTSGGSGEFTNFAPVGSSNVQAIGDLAQGASLTANQALIVNVTTNPGAYSLKISFSYLDERGRPFTDDQVITLLVYSLPMVGVDFYQATGEFYAGQPNSLPLQIVNMGRKVAVLGNMRVSAEGAEVMNNMVLVGNLEPGGYFPLDAQLIPQQAGPLTLEITVEYTDDFNQPQKITKTIPLEIKEAPVMEPMPEGTPGPGGSMGPLKPGEPSTAVQETFMAKVLRFLRGMFGLDSAINNPTINSGNYGVPSPEKVPPQQSTPVQAVPLKGP